MTRVRAASFHSQGNQFDTALLSFHQFSIDGGPEQRYSDPINGEDLVPTANPMFRLPHPMSVVPTTLSFAPQSPKTHIHMVTVSTAYPGGYFFA